MTALSRGPRAAGSALLAGIVLFAALLAWASSPRAVFADDPPTTAAKADATASATADATKEEDLESLLLRNWRTLLALLAVKWIPAAAGIAFIVLHYVRRGEIARGVRPPDPVRPPPTAPFRVVPAMIVLVVLFVAPLILLTALQAAGLAPRVESTKDLSLAWRIGLTGGASVVVAAAVIGRRSWLRSRGAPAPLPTGAALLSGGRAFCVFAALGIAIGLATTLILKGVFHLENKAQDLVHDVVHSTNPLDPWLITVFGIAVAPLVEECVHRGMVFAGLRTVMGRIPSIALSSLLFAGLHLQKVEDLHSFVPLVGLAALLAVLYERTNSLVAVVVVHALNNATTLLPLLLLRGA